MGGLQIADDCKTKQRATTAAVDDRGRTHHNAFIYHQQLQEQQEQAAADGRKLKEFPSGDWLNRQQDEKDGEHGTSKDVFFKGDADDGFIALAAELGWLQELSAYLDRMADDSATKLRAAIGRVD